MRAGRRWIALDADFFANHFTDRILDRFGPAGVCLFVAFLCACKRSRIQGQISYVSDAEALAILGLQTLPLVDSSGDKWCLDDFWKYCGTQKQTSRTYRGRVKNVKSTHWGLWQNSFRRQAEAERKATSRQVKRPDTYWTAVPKVSGHITDTNRTESESDSETPLPPEGADASQRQNGNVNGLTGRAAELKANLRGHDG